MQVLRLLVQRVQLQQTLAEQPRLTQLSQLVVRVGYVIYTLVGLKAVVNESYSPDASASSYLQRFLLTSPTRIYPCSEQGRTHS